MKKIKVKANINDIVTVSDGTKDNNLIKYVEQDNTKVTIDLNNTRIIRNSKESYIIIDLLKEKIYIKAKDINYESNINIKVDSILNDFNHFEAKYIVEEDKFKYILDIEEM